MTFKDFYNSGRISKLNTLEDTTKLHRLATDVIIYKDNVYIEMLKDGRFLYRPSGKGFGKRSVSLENVERFVFNELYESDINLFI